jgi:hypothetical protein
MPLESWRICRKPVGLEQLAPPPAPFGERQAAQGAHERDRVVRFHGRIEPALLGQVADQAGDVLRVGVTEHAPFALVGIDDPEQHPERRGLPGAVGSENAVDRAFGHRQVDSVDRQGAIEALDETARLDRKIAPGHAVA